MAYAYHVPCTWNTTYNVPVSSAVRATCSHIMYVLYHVQSNTEAIPHIHWFAYHCQQVASHPLARYHSQHWDWLALLGSTHRARSMALDFDASSLRARPAKRSRLEADRRRDMFQRVANKFADIDFTKYQYLHARTTDAAETAGSGRGRIVPVKPVPTALVENWRHLESYECDGDKSYSEEQFLMLHSRAGHHRRYYTGPFGCTVQFNVPHPGELLRNAAKPMRGRSALQKLQKQLGTMCVRLEVDHFRGRASADISDAELLAANATAQAVGGEHAALTAAEAAAWAPPAYPLDGDGLKLGGRSARTRAAIDSDVVDMLLGKGEVMDALCRSQRAGAGGAGAGCDAFLAAFGVLRGVICGKTHVTELEEVEMLFERVWLGR